MNFNELFEYNTSSPSGLIRKKGSGGIKAGSVAGGLGQGGYYYVSVNKKRYLVHRVVYEMHHGSIPEGQLVDHKDGNKENNAIENLRLATISQNGQNRLAPKSNTSGFKGVSMRKDTGKWQAVIYVNKVRHHLGYFESPEAASKAYQEAAVKMFGEFNPITTL